MKPGDKAWVFQASSQEIVEGVCADSVRYGNTTYITIDFTLPNGTIIKSGGLVLGTECFPTREALCEHYRKIFEDKIDFPRKARVINEERLLHNCTVTIFSSHLVYLDYDNESYTKEELEFL